MTAALVPRLRLPLAMLAGIFVLAACGGDSGEPRNVSLAELVANAPNYDGQAVRTRGLVKSFDDPRHYWLEDENINRVGLEPRERIAPHLDRRVSITGRFTYSPERGRRIRISSIDAYDAQR